MQHLVPEVRWLLTNELSILLNPKHIFDAENMDDMIPVLFCFALKKLNVYYLL